MAVADDGSDDVRRKREERRRRGKGLWLFRGRAQSVIFQQRRMGTGATWWLLLS